MLLFERKKTQKINASSFFEYHSLVAQGPADSVIKSIADKAIFFTVASMWFFGSIRRGKTIGGGADKAFEKLKDAIGVGKFEAELVLLDPKQKPNEENDVKIKRFCEKL